MGGAHTVDGLHHDGDTLVHRLAPEAKIAATLCFVLAVVATPREAVWAFAADAAIAVLALLAARLPVGMVVRRLRIEVPFLAFALFLPLVGHGPHTTVLGVALSRPGLWAAWNIVVKGTLGLTAAIVLAATTPVAELLAGVERLRAPRVLVAIAGFMARYLDVVVGEANRMRIARLSRADNPRWLWQARAVAATGGTLFVRSYERGERVYVAMLARGYDGSMPPLHCHASPVPRWYAATPAIGAAAVMLAARLAA